MCVYLQTIFAHYMQRGQIIRDVSKSVKGLNKSLGMDTALYKDRHILRNGYCAI